MMIKAYVIFLSSYHTYNKNFTKTNSLVYVDTIILVEISVLKLQYWLLVTVKIKLKTVFVGQNQTSSSHALDNKWMMQQIRLILMRQGIDAPKMLIKYVYLLYLLMYVSTVLYLP